MANPNDVTPPGGQSSGASSSPPDDDDIEDISTLDIPDINVDSIIRERQRERGTTIVGITAAWQEVVRGFLAFTFVGIFFFTIWFSFTNLDSATWANTKELLQVLLPAETALIGSAVGFYFGSRR